jgi:hypothetical protein
LRSTSSLIRSSCLHALTKFSDWIVKQDGLIEYFAHILLALKDPDTNVQEAACTCLAMNLSAFKNELLDLTKEQQDKILILTEPVL